LKSIEVVAVAFLNTRKRAVQMVPMIAISQVSVLKFTGSSKKKSDSLTTGLN